MAPPVRPQPFPDNVDSLVRDLEFSLAAVDIAASRPSRTLAYPRLYSGSNGVSFAGNSAFADETTLPGRC